MMSKLTVGEDYLSSDLFDSWRYTGLSLASDESQLPPKLRGYAPEVSGIARTNAKVTVSQQGRVIHETTVAAGPFRIQELNSALTGRLDVRVEEQDGSVQTFAVETAQVPYLTRPGQLRYKMTTGRPRDYNHSTQGPYFATGELSWGLTNAWSLYGGGIISQDYNSLALGAGRDMNAYGTLSADVTHASARFPADKSRQGRSWRLSYSKRFDEINSEVTFAGYRFPSATISPWVNIWICAIGMATSGTAKSFIPSRRPKTLPTCVCQRTSTGRIRLTGTARRPIATAYR